jgi:hypothetical protein
MLIRIRLQLNAKHPETFTPHIISLKPDAYKSMVVTMNLPYRGIESTSAVGPFFWCAYDQDEENPHLRMLRFPFFTVSFPLNMTLTGP